MVLRVSKPNYMPGEVIQVVNTQTGEVDTGVTLIPYDDTIPQISEGDEYMTLAVTPKFATSKLKIDVVFNYGHTSGTTRMVAALFKDAILNALAAASSLQNSGNTLHQIMFTHFVIAGTVLSITFRVRAGSNLAGTLTFNGTSGARQYGGVLSSSITITEIKV